MHFCLLVEGDKRHLDDNLLVMHLKMLTDVKAMKERPSWSPGLISQTRHHYNEWLGVLRRWRTSPWWQVTSHAVIRGILVPVACSRGVSSDFRFCYVGWWMISDCLAMLKLLINYYELNWLWKNYCGWTIIDSLTCWCYMRWIWLALLLKCIIIWWLIMY